MWIKLTKMSEVIVIHIRMFKQELLQGKIYIISNPTSKTTHAPPFLPIPPRVPRATHLHWENPEKEANRQTNTGGETNTSGL